VETRSLPFGKLQSSETALRRVADHWQLPWELRLEVELIQADASVSGIRASGIYWAVDLATKRYLNG
jgi:hypothetical protein